MSTQNLQVTNSDTAVATLTQSRAGKYLTFFLAGEEYGLEILKVSEIIGLQPITRVPRMPEFVRQWKAYIIARKENPEGTTTTE